MELLTCGLNSILLCQLSTDPQRGRMFNYLINQLFYWRLTSTVVSLWMMICKEVAVSTFLFCLLFWLNVDRTLLQNMCTLFKCINTTQVLVISPVSFQSSDWKQLSICFLSYFSWFNYLIELIFIIKYSFLIINC